MVIVWSKPAREDLRLIFQYIANDSPRYATRVIQDIVDKVGTLAELPNIGRVRKTVSGLTFHIMFSFIRAELVQAFM